MDSRYLKAAVVLAIVSFFFISALFATILIVSKNSPHNSAAQSDNCPQEQAIALTEQFIRSTATYAFDGIEGSLKRLKVKSADGGKSWQLDYVFKCQHPGYGDRSGQALMGVVTEHSTQVTIRDCRIVAAICDQTYDLLTERQIK